MFKLTKPEAMTLGTLTQNLRDKANELNEAVDAYNNAVREAAARLSDQTAEFNEALEALRAFTQDVARERDEEFADKSERWQESKKGEAARSFIDAWEAAELDLLDVEFSEPDEVTVDVPDFESVVSDLPSSADEA